MKLVYPEIDFVFKFACGTFPSAVIENPRLFYRFLDDLQRQCCGEDGAAILSVDDKPVPIAGNLDLITQFFPFEINRKTLLNKVLSRLEKHAVAPEFYERSQQLLSNLEKLIYDLAFQYDLELETSKLSIGALLKSAGIMLKEEYPTLAEKLLVYMDLMCSNGLAAVFILVNLHSLLDDKTLELFTECCCQKEYKILLIDNKEYNKLPRENRLLIDADLCEL